MRRPSRNTPWMLTWLAAALLAPAGAQAQTFMRVLDAANPVVADAGAPGYAGASWVDVDRDGWVDLFVGDRALYRNLGGGTFSRTLIPHNVATLGNSWADVDNDGDNDLMVAGGINGGRGTRLFRNDGSAFTRVTTGPIGDSLGNVGWSCAWGDYDADGLVDLVVACAFGFTSSTPNRLLHNLGPGGFAHDLSTDVTVGTAPYTVPSWCDFDLDGDLDLSIGAGPVTAKGPDYFYRNRRKEGGSPLLARITTGALATDLRDGQVVNWVDYDNDGDLDCFITNYNQSTNSLYRNDAGTYVLMTGAVGPIATDLGTNTASVWNDYDNDGDLDCFLTRLGVPSRYYRNEGNGTFTLASVGEPGSAPAITATAADWDRDGDVDLYVSAPGTSKGLFRNDLAPGRHWLELDLTGVASNRSAIGTRVRVRAVINGQEVWQLREVSAQNTFNGHSSFIQHFGLGDATQVAELRIEWPGGLVETLFNVDADTILALTEGESGGTPVAVALVTARVIGRGVELTWEAPGLEGVAGTVVQRRSADGAWTDQGTPSLAGGGRLSYLDANVDPGRWAYRLSVTDADGAWFTSETWVEVPASALAVRVIAGGSSQKSLRIAFTLPAEGDADAHVIDAAGRVLAHAALGVRPVGTGTAELPVTRLPAGVYWVRLTHLGRSVAASTVVRR